MMRYNLTIQKALTLAGSVLLLLNSFSLDIIANTWNETPSDWKNPDSLTSKTDILLSPFMKTKENNSLFLVNSPSSVDQHIEYLIMEHSPNVQIEIKSTPINGPTDNSNNSFGKKFHFYYQNVRLCEFELKAHGINTDMPLILGSIPDIDTSPYYGEYEWPDDQSALANLETQAYFTLGYNPGFTMNAKEKCFIVRNGILVPAWLMKVDTESQLRYEGIADDHMTYYLEPKFFHVDGSARVYDKNAKDGVLVDYPLKDLTGNQKLSNKYFYTELNDPSYTAATSANYVFNFDPVTQLSQFQETSIFTHATKHLEWLIQHSYTKFGSKRVRLLVHAVVNNEVNNALYQPDAGPAPTIYVGDGDGTTLANLATDEDVVSHEFGHHVIYRTLTTVTGQSLSLHEGLADSFVFVRKGNACLGESICPDNNLNSRICEIKGKCLRSGDNTILYDAAEKMEGHKAGQFVSGYIWDLFSKEKIPQNDLSEILQRAIDFFVYNSGYQHLVISLMYADKELYKGSYCSKIYLSAYKRGMGPIIKDFGCGPDTLSDSLQGLDTSLAKGQFPEKPSSTSQTTQAPTVKTTTKTSKGGGICGTIKTGNNSHSSYILLSFFAAIPVILVLFMPRTKKAPAPVVVRKKRF
ncbi:MAG: hypothetical protein HQK54_00170 [Oligoflexales bacterium]|nr:hypothetical protein [Oligoflexales bacterium]